MFSQPEHPYTLPSRAKASAQPKLVKEYGCSSARTERMQQN